jgi:hypothetical protein
MTRRNLKAALGHSLQAEEQRIKEKFDRADNLIKGIEDSSVKNDPEPPQPKPHKTVVRDSFTLPEDDYQLIDLLRQRCLKNGMSATKSEIVRAGMHSLNILSDEALIEVLQGLLKIKTGRPTKKMV